MYAKMTV